MRTSQRRMPQCVTSMRSLPCNNQSSSRNPSISPRQKTTLKFAQEQQIRYDGLMETGCGTIQRAQQTDGGVGRKDRAVAARKIRSLAAERKVDVLTIERAKGAANWIAPEQSNNRWHLTWPTP